MGDLPDDTSAHVPTGTPAHAPTGTPAGSSTDTGVPDAEGLPKDRPRSIGRRILSGVLSYGLVVAIFAFLIPKLAGGGDSLQEALRSISTTTWVVMIVLGLVNLATNWPPICVGLPGLRLREAGVANTASAAVSNTVPEGGAVATGLTYAMERSWGFRLEAITLGFMATGIWTNLVRYGMLAVGLVVWAVEERSGRLGILAAVVSAVMLVAFTLLVLVLRRQGFAAALGRLLGHVISPWIRFRRRSHPDVTRPDMEAELVTFRADLSSLLSTRWHALTATMVVSQIAAVAVLGVALRLQGVTEAEVSWARIVVAWGSASLIALLMPVPGGVGVVEAALLAVLGWQQSDPVQADVLSAIIAYRFATWLLPIPVGAGSYLFWRYNRSWRHSPDVDHPLGASVSGRTR